jgi:acyl-coenzyme A thioesterase PaaI-like protein
MSADLDALVALMPFAGQLGLVLDEAGADRVVARLDWAPQLCTTAGVLHGGVPRWRCRCTGAGPR